MFTLASVFQIGMVPALLVAGAALRVTYGLPPEQARRCLLLLLAALATAILAVCLLADRLAPEPAPSLLSALPLLLMPTLIGVLALSLLHLGSLPAMPLGSRLLVLALLAAQGGMLYLLRDSRLGVGYFVLPGVLLLVVVWGIGLRSRRAALLLCAAAALGLAFVHRSLWNQVPPLPLVDQIRLPLAASFYLIPALLVSLPAALIISVLRPPAGEPEGQGRRFTRREALLLALALLLPLLPAYVIYWGAIWDQTDDGIFAVVVVQAASVFAIGAGLALLLTLRGGYRLLGLVYMWLIPAVAWQAMALGMQTSHHTITEERAAHIAEALAQYQGREGHYPVALAELAPGDLLFIPQPLLLPGETWCYQAAGDAYRLEAFYREFFSGPVSLRTYQSVGAAPATACADRLAAVQERFFAPLDNPAPD
jgi:hypothetical protein